MNETLEEWRRGEDSPLLPMERLKKHNLWLKKQHQELKDKIFQRNKEEEKPPVGFVKL